MIYRRAGVRTAAGLLIAAGGPLIAAPAWAGGGTGDKVTLCHRTDANNNPYVSITVDPDAVFRQGHDGHTGPIWDSTLKAHGEKWGDIIPPFDYTVKHGQQTTTHHYDGMNWTTQGQQIQSSGCQTPQPSPSQSPSGSTSPSQGSSGTPSSTPTHSATPSQSPPSQSPTESGSPSQSPTGTSSPSASVLPTSSSLSPTESPSNSTSPSGSPSPSTTVLPTRTERPPTPKPPLPFTGFPVWPLSLIGIGFVAGGVAIIRRYAL